MIRVGFSSCEALGQWWRTYGTRVRGGTHSSLCGHAHRRSSAEFITRDRYAGPGCSQDWDSHLKRHCVVRLFTTSSHSLPLHYTSRSSLCQRKQQKIWQCPQRRHKNRKIVSCLVLLTVDSFTSWGLRHSINVYESTIMSGVWAEDESWRDL